MQPPTFTVLPTQQQQKEIPPSGDGEDDALINIAAYTNNLVATQLTEIAALRRQHEAMMTIAADVNKLMGVMCPEGWAASWAGGGSGRGGGRTGINDADNHEEEEEQQYNRQQSLELITPPCCEDGTDELFGGPMDGEGGSSGRGGIMGRMVFGDSGQGSASGPHDNDHKQQVPLPSASSAFLTTTALSLSASHTLHDAILTASRKGSLIADEALHTRLVGLFRDTNNNGCGDGTRQSSADGGGRGEGGPQSAKSSGSDSQLHVTSFLALLPLCEAWLMRGATLTSFDLLPPSATTGSSTVADATAPPCITLWDRIETAFVLLHEGLRMFQPNALFEDEASIGATMPHTTAPAPIILRRQQWERLLAVLEQCNANRYFLRQLYWRDAVPELIAFLRTALLGALPPAAAT